MLDYSQYTSGRMSLDMGVRSRFSRDGSIFFEKTLVTSKIDLLRIKSILILWSCFFSVSLFGQTPSWSIAKSFGGTSSEFVKSIKLDRQGNIIMVGNYFSIDFQIDTAQLLSLGSQDIFIVKLNPSGNLLWAKSIGGTNSDINSSTSIDSQGNIYVTGYFMSDSILIDNLILYNPAPQTSGPLFLIKLDPSGNVLFAETTLNTQFTFGEELAIDSNDDLLVTGSSTDTVIYFNQDTLFFPHPNTGTQSFIYNINASGNTNWSKALSGALFATNCITETDHFGNSIYTLTGDSILYLDSTIISQSNHSINIYLIKLDSNGNLIWTNHFRGSNQVTCHSIAVNRQADIYIVGNSHSDTLSFDSFQLFNPTNSDNIFIAKYDSAGNFIWAKYFGGLDLDEGYDVSVNSDGGPTIIGYYTSSVLLVDSIQLQNSVAGYSNIYLIRYDKDGDLIYAENYGGYGYDEGMALTIDTSDVLYICGQFSSNNILFNNLSLTNTTQSYDIYFLKSDLPLSAESMKLTDVNNLIKIFPNPSTGHFQVVSSESLEKITVCDPLGKIVYERNYLGTVNKSASFNLSEIGIYFIKVQMKNVNVTSRIVIEQ